MPRMHSYSFGTLCIHIFTGIWLERHRQLQQLWFPIHWETAQKCTYVTLDCFNVSVLEKKTAIKSATVSLITYVLLKLLFGGNFDSANKNVSRI